MRNQARNIWILGGTGYAGRALATHLSRNAGNRLHLLLHKNADYRFLEGFNTFTGSLQNFDGSLLGRYPPDVIFHLARAGGKTALARYVAARQGEMANRRIVDILCGLPDPPVVVYVSGSLMYGRRPDDDPASEDSQLVPGSYARWYHRNEIPWMEARESGSLDVRFARPGWIAGPGSWFREFFWNHYRATGKIPCYGDGNQLMPLVHIDDFAAMTDALSRYGERSGNLNIFAGPAIRQNDFCVILSRLLDAEILRIPYGILCRRYGRTVAGALVSSIPMKTNYPEIHEKAGVRFEDAGKLLSHVTGLLKNDK